MWRQWHDNKDDATHAYDAFRIGGGLASLSILLDENIGWRGTGLVVSVIGLVTAVLGAATVRDPRHEMKLIDSQGCIFSRIVHVQLFCVHLHLHDGLHV